MESTNSKTFCYEYITFNLENKKTHKVKLAGTTEEPYFCGKDVCETLGYENESIKTTLFKLVEPENKKELKDLGPNDPQKVVDNLATTFLGINRPLTFNEGKAIYINEDGLRYLINGSRIHKNKTLFLNQVDKWLLDTCSELVDFFSFIRGYNLAFDLESGWFQDLWYPLTKKQFLNSNHEKDTRYGANFGLKPNHSQPPQMGGLTMVRNRPPIASQSSSKSIHEKDTGYGANVGPNPNHSQPSQMAGLTMVRNHPFIITQNIIEWMGFEGRDISDKQERFARMLKRNTIPYYEIDCNHPFALEYSCVQREIQTIPKNNLDKKRWICMDPKDFKKTVLRLNTKTADMVRDFYLNLEEAVVAYSEYTLSYMVEKATLENRVAKSQLATKDEQLALKEKSEEEMKEKLVRAERKAIRVNKFMRRIVVKEHKLEWIYIATNDQYARERLFKIGSTTRLSSRIASYNTGRAKGVDTYYYVWAIKCYNSKDVDNHIQKLLSEFKYGKNQDVSKENRSEMYHGIKFTDLKDIVAFIVNNYDESMDYINNFIKTRLNQSMEEEDDIPPPLNYKKLTYQIGEHTETIDVENEETESIREALEDILSSLKDQEERTISREALLTQLLSVTNASKQSLWSQIKEFTGWKNSKTEIDEGSFRYKIVY